MVRFVPRRATHQADPAAGSDAGRGVTLDAATTQAVPVAEAPVAGSDSTAALDRSAAAASVDPDAATSVIDVRGAPAVRAQSGPGPIPALLSRRSAAEVGMYAGAALMVLAMVAVAARGWPDWSRAMRVGGLALGSVALVAAGLFVRLPWARPEGAERRRAVSTMLTIGVGLGLAALGVLLGMGQAPFGAAGIGHAIVAVVAMLGVCAAARTPLSEVALLASLAWGVWLVVPAGTARWSTLLGLGIAWAALAARGARGQRTAVAAGALLALVASVVLAQGEWAWPVRGVLAAVVVVALVMFARGGPNSWLALAAGAATALAAAVAGGVLGPALALFIGGLATMVVSGVALRAAAPRSSRARPSD